MSVETQKVVQSPITTSRFNKKETVDQLWQEVLLEVQEQIRPSRSLMIQLYWSKLQGMNSSSSTHIHLHVAWSMLAFSKQRMDAVLITQVVICSSMNQLELSQPSKTSRLDMKILSATCAKIHILLLLLRWPMTSGKYLSILNVIFWHRPVLGPENFPILTQVRPVQLFILVLICLEMTDHLQEYKDVPSPVVTCFKLVAQQLLLTHMTTFSQLLKQAQH